MGLQMLFSFSFAYMCVSVRVVLRVFSCKFLLGAKTKQTKQNKTKTKQNTFF
jgi:hypothetical protein